MPVLSTTLLLTFSRGSIAAGAVGLLALVLLGRTRALASGLLATVPTTLVAVAAGYAAELLASPTPTAPAAAYQGHIVAVVVALCVLVAVVARWLLLRLDSGSITIPLPALLADPRLARPLQAVAGLLIVLGLLVWPVNLPQPVRQASSTARRWTPRICAAGSRPRATTVASSTGGRRSKGSTRSRCTAPGQGPSPCSGIASAGPTSSSCRTRTRCMSRCSASWGSSASC